MRFSIDARNVTNAFGYDAAGQQITITNAFLTSVQMAMTNAYDENGNRTVTTDALGRSMTNVYDALNRVATNWFPDGTKVVMTYDAGGRKIAQTDQATNKTLFVYDGLGRLTSVTNALNKATQYGYDEAGNQTTQVDALNRTNQFEYDAMGRRTKHFMPDTNLMERFAYDLVGNLIYHTNFNNVIITNQYDVMNRLTNRISTNGYQVSFTYTDSGQRQSMTDASGLTTYVYDNRDRLRTNATPEGTLYYRYDASGNLTNVWSGTSGGVSNIYQYDSLNRLTTVLTGGSTAASYGFDAVGNLQAMAYGNGVTNLYQYDSLNRLTNLTWKLTGSTLASFYYQLGPTGNRTNLQEYVNGPSPVNRTNRWTYDTLYRLTLEAMTTNATVNSLGYGYDDVGNRLTRAVTNFAGVGLLTNQTFTFNTNDWLNSDAYDNNGNTTNSAATNYVYDVENRLTGVSWSGHSVAIVYDGDGRRAGKTVDGLTTLYLVDERNPSGYAQVMEEFTVSGTTNLTRAYTYGLELISQRLIGTSTNFYGYDGHGSVRFLLNTPGAVTDTYSYDAYGTLISPTGTTPNHYLYCSEQFDSDLGSYFLRARYLNPNTGRFWTMDTYEGNNKDPLSLHKYLYCQGNPVNGVDPSGLEMTWESYMGYAAEEAIEDEYEATHPVDKVAYGSRQPFGTSFLKSDIFNTSKKTFLEIKPISVSGIGKGLAKIGIDETAFGPLTLKYGPEVAWQPRSHLLTTTDGDTIFVINVGGLVLYKDINQLEWELM